MAPRRPVRVSAHSATPSSACLATGYCGRRTTPRPRSPSTPPATKFSGDSIIDLNGGVAGVFTEVRANNAIAYVSPSFSGFSMAAAVVPGEETVAAQGANAADGLRPLLGWPDVLGLWPEGWYRLTRTCTSRHLRYGRRPGDAPGRRRYTFNNFSVGAQYESDDNRALSPVLNTKPGL